MDTVITLLPAQKSDRWFRGERQRISKSGGALGPNPRFYIVSRVDSSDDIECMAFRLNGPEDKLTDYHEVAGYPRNGASIAEIIAEVRANDAL